MNCESVLPGIDVLISDDCRLLSGLRIALLTNKSARNRQGRQTIGLLKNAPAVNLAALFSPEHGLEGSREGAIEDTSDENTGLPVFSLYGATRRPEDRTAEGLDAIVIDLQDAGVRFYTYATTMAYVLEFAAAKGLKVFVLDRPNPIGPAGVRGPVLEPDLRSFIGYFPLPLQHGMTIGELALLFNSENAIGASLSVVPMKGYRRALWYDETGLGWTCPSPNLRTVEQAILYPGVALIEAANVSVGRGTDTPFQLAGAPWIEGGELLAALENRPIPGIGLEAADFTPKVDPYAGAVCRGVAFRLANRSAFDAPRLGIELASSLFSLDAEQFSIDKTLSHLGSKTVLSAIKTGRPYDEIAGSWEPGLRNFMLIRQRYLLY